MATPPSSPAKLNYKVEYEIPPLLTKTPRQIRTYMTTPESRALYEPDPKDETQVINDDLLQIISKGIDNIVFNLKTKLGNNFEESNDKASEISSFLDALKTQIDTGTFMIGRNNDRTDANGAIKIDIDTNRTHTVNPDKRDFYRQDIDPNIDYDTIDIKTDHEFRNLDNNYDSILRPNIQDRVNRGITQSNDAAEINRRLLNCQNLEFLYLKKHDEIMKIFEFTINLFDKYKYAIKVILFLLKNLVYKEPGTGTTPTIDLPLPIISNIKKLVEDQNKVQGIIDNMKTSLDKNDNKNFKDDESHIEERLINTKNKQPIRNPNPNPNPP